MAKTSGELFEALEGLRKAALSEFSGNAYYLISGEITDLFEVLGPRGAALQAYQESGSANFEAALGRARKMAEADLTGNPFYRVAHKLDLLSFLSAAAARAEAKLDLPGAAPSVSAMGGSFDSLAAASKSRVDQAAASLGIAPTHAGPAMAANPETLADGELERRSSEPCFLAELPPAMEPMAPSAISSNLAGAPPAAEAANNLGLSPVSVERSSDFGTDPAPETAKKAPEGAVQASAAAYDPASPAAGQAVGGESAPGPRQKEPKTLFGLWLDMLFGRKD